MIKKNLERDIGSFFEESSKMLPEGKKKALMILFDKYMHITSADTLFEKYDFDLIKSSAVDLYKNLNFPKKFNGSYQQISSEESANFCLVLATINYLHGKDCLKKTPKFNLTKE